MEIFQPLMSTCALPICGIKKQGSSHQCQLAMSDDICVIVEAAVHRIKSEISNERNNAFLNNYFQRLLIANSNEIQDPQGDSNLDQGDSSLSQGDSNRNLKDSSLNLGESNPNQGDSNLSQGDSNLDQGDSSLLRSQRHQGAPQDNFEVSDKV